MNSPWVEKRNLQGTPYWINMQTNQTSSVMPRELAAVQMQSMPTQSPILMQAPPALEWEEKLNLRGKPFWVKKSTGEITQHMPYGFEEAKNQIAAYNQSMIQQQQAQSPMAGATAVDASGQGFSMQPVTGQGGAYMGMALQKDGSVAPDGSHIGVPPADCYPLETEEEKEERIKKKKDLKKVELLTPDYALFRLEKLFARQGYYGLPNTDGEWLSNFKAHMKNEHSILSIFFTHEAAPFSRTERAMYLYIIWGMTFFITAFINFWYS